MLSEINIKNSDKISEFFPESVFDCRSVHFSGKIFSLNFFKERNFFYSKKEIIFLKQREGKVYQSNCIIKSLLLNSF